MTKAPPSLIFLIGFMGAGKTTVGQALAGKLRYRFIDLDRVIEETQGRTITEIFLESGEPEFRRLEQKAVRECHSLASAVVALGGGAYGSEENRSLIRSIGTTVWLDCPLDVCLSRIACDESRPLLGQRQEMETMFAWRRPHYEQADLVVGSGTSPDETVDAIVELLTEVSPDESS
jgi:shikimate kinase